MLLIIIWTISGISTIFNIITEFLQQDFYKSRLTPLGLHLYEAHFKTCHVFCAQR